MPGKFQTRKEINFMQDIAIEDIDDSWKELWGQSIKSKPLRHAIENTPRLSEKIIQEILRTAKKTIKTRTSQDFEITDELLKLIANYTKFTPKILKKRVGLCLLGKKIKDIFNSPQVHDLLKQLTKEEIIYAIERQETSIDHCVVSYQSLESDLEKIGTYSCLIWLKKFPDEIALPLAVRLPQQIGQIIEIPENIAAKAVEKVLIEV